MELKSQTIKINNIIVDIDFNSDGSKSFYLGNDIDGDIESITKGSFRTDEINIDDLIEALNYIKNLEQ